MSILIKDMEIMPINDTSTVGTECQICDAFIPLIGARASYSPRICDECKKRLKELLYPKEE